MKRRDFVKLFGGAAMAWPSGGLAQQAGGMRRVGVLTQYFATDLAGQQEVSILTTALAKLGWVRNRNLQLDVRWAGGNMSRALTEAKELVDLRPDAIAAIPSSMVAAVLRETKTIPVVFAGVTDPVGLGFVKSFAHPGGNATGFAQLELSFYGKWLQTLKEIAPKVSRVLAIVSPDPGSGARRSVPTLRTVAQSLNLAFVARYPRNQAELLDAIMEFAREPGGGLLQLPDAVIAPFLHAELAAAAHYRLPAIYGTPDYTEAGGLIFYGSGVNDQLPDVAAYLDRILRGANPADLPVQSPTAFKLIINLKAANALGLRAPESLLLRADQVIR
jgi:putative tryptophan/tyrosine transport system substrate-binding protein